MSTVHESRFLVELETTQLIADRLAGARTPRRPSQGSIRRRRRTAAGLRRLAERLES